MATTTTLDTLKINYLTQAQYDEALENSEINENEIYLTPQSGGGGSGTVTSIGISNATNGGLSVSGSPITSSGSITIGHSNVLNSAQTTQAVYPIKIDKNGHISDYGSAVTIPDVSGKIDTAGTGLSKSGTTLNHSNSVNAQSTSAVYPITIDAQGHIASYGTAVTIPTVPSQLIGTTSNTTPTQVATALANNQNIEISHTDSTFGTIKVYNFNNASSINEIVGNAVFKYGDDWICYELHGNTSTDTWGALDTTLAEMNDVPHIMTWYGTCSTTASTATKTVTCSGFDLIEGNIIGILFTTGNTAATPTLTINSKTNKSIYVGNSTPNGTDNVLKWSANTMVYFLYDGTYFRYITSISAGTVTPSRGANTWYGTSNTGATTQAKTSTIDNFVLTKGAVVYITFSTANTYTSAKLTLNINSTGAKDVYYNNAVTSSTNTLLWNVGETLIFIYSGSYWYYVGKSVTKVSQLVNDSGFTTNSGTVTSVGLSNAADGGLTISGSPVTGSGSITVGHSNVLTNAQTTEAVYPIKIDKNGHISSYGSAVTITSGTVTSVSAGTGLTTSITNNGAITSSGTIKAKLNSESSLGTIGTTDKLYAVGVDSNGQLCVNVPWSGGSGSVTGMTTTAGAPTVGVQTVSNGIITTTIPTKISHLANDSGFVTTDTKNTAGSTNSTSKIYLIGATSQADNPQTYSNSRLYYDGGLYSQAYSNPVDTYISQTTGSITLNCNDSNTGTSTLIVGANGTNVKGDFRLYASASSTYYTKLVSSADSSNKTLTLPNATGTVALTSDIPTVPSITLNGSSTTSPSFYAPTSAGTSGYVLQSNGSGAPSWANVSLTDENLKVTTTSNNTDYKLVLMSGNATKTGTGNMSSEFQASTDGTYSTLQVGGGYRGQIKFGYTSGSVQYNTTLISSHTTQGRTLTLPNKTGTLAVTDDIPSLSMSASSGTLTITYS